MTLNLHLHLRRSSVFSTAIQYQLYAQFPQHFKRINILNIKFTTDIWNLCLVRVSTHELFHRNHRAAGSFHMSNYPRVGAIKEISCWSLKIIYSDEICDLRESLLYLAVRLDKETPVTMRLCPLG